MEKPELNTYVYLVWLTIKKNKIVRSKEKRYPLLVPGRFTRNEFHGLWDSPYPQKEFMYFHISDPESSRLTHVPIPDSTTDPTWKGIEFEPTLPVYHEFTTLYFIEWIPIQTQSKSKTKKHLHKSHNHTRKKWRGPKFAYSIFRDE